MESSINQSSYQSLCVCVCACIAVNAHAMPCHALFCTYQEASNRASSCKCKPKFPFPPQSIKLDIIDGDPTSTRSVECDRSLSVDDRVSFVG